MVFIVFVIGLVALVYGADLFLKGVDAFGIKWRISPVIMGLTVVAFATGAPELAISIKAAANGSADLVLGNIIGSNIANILLIIGIGSVMKAIAITPRILKVDLPIVLFVSLVLYWISSDGSLSKLDGVILISMLIAYSIFTFFQIKKSRAEHKIVDLYEPNINPDNLDDGLKFYAINLGWLAIGLVMIVMGSDWMVDSAIEIATLFGISELIIGLTIVSIGTSLPEVATSIAIIRKGNPESAIGNVLGSNLYNVLLTLGITILITPQVLQVSSIAINFDLPIMVGVIILCFPIFITGMKITRSEGVVFLLYYASYLTILTLDAISSPYSESFDFAMIWIVIPATALFFTSRFVVHLLKRAAS